MCWRSGRSGCARSILPGGSYREGRQLDTAGRTQLIEQIKAQPYLFVAQTSSPLSTAPVLEDGRLRPRPVMLRGFAVAENDGYRVMPGGLARVSSGMDTLQAALQKGGISKDWWVLAPTRNATSACCGRRMAQSW